MVSKTGTRLELRRMKEEIVALKEEMWAAAGGVRLGGRGDGEGDGGTGTGQGEWSIPCPQAKAGSTGRGGRRVRRWRRRGISGVRSGGVAMGVVPVGGR